MHRIYCTIITALTCLLLFFVMPVQGETRKILPPELDKIKKEHLLWLNTNQVSGERAPLSNANLSKEHLEKVDLSGADLTEANLSNANLNEAKLIHAELSKADLHHANLFNADLSHARLHYADLRGADLRAAILSNADLRNANLSGADLRNANLSNAYLGKANLSGADLIGAKLREAFLGGADLGDAVFEPDELPKAKGMVLADNLSKMKYEYSPHALTDLREVFKKAGLRAQEREVSYAISHINRKRLWKESEILKKIESAFNLVFFELTCAYGMSPGRLFLILVGFTFVFTIPYKISLSNDDMDGIWVVWISDRVRQDLGAKKPVRLTGSGFPTLKVAFYFSIQSAFSIGWRELNVGNWIARLQKYEYTLRATGWVRTVSGIQSLISVYLLALWVLTFFGRPFENL